MCEVFVQCTDQNLLVVIAEITANIMNDKHVNQFRVLRMRITTVRVTLTAQTRDIPARGGDLRVLCTQSFVWRQRYLETTSSGDKYPRQITQGVIRGVIAGRGSRIPVLQEKIVPEKKRRKGAGVGGRVTRMPQGLTPI